MLFCASFLCTAIGSSTLFSSYILLVIQFLFCCSQKIQNEAGSILDADRGKKGGRVKSKSVGTRKATTARKESRTYSSLIFTMEQFEKHLIQLDKKTKVQQTLSTISAVSRCFLLFSLH